MTRLIKKYKNRRLYDTEISQYITIEELQRYVIDGIIFRVEESASNEDLTSATLLQIFVEMESGASQFLSPEMLRQLIIAAHHPLNASFKGTLAHLFSAMEKSMLANPYLTSIKESTDLWQEQMQAITKQWQDIFKSPLDK